MIFDWKLNQVTNIHCEAKQIFMQFRTLSSKFSHGIRIMKPLLPKNFLSHIFFYSSKPRIESKGTSHMHTYIGQSERRPIFSPHSRSPKSSPQFPRRVLLFTGPAARTNFPEIPLARFSKTKLANYMQPPQKISDALYTLELCL